MTSFIATFSMFWGATGSKRRRSWNTTNFILSFSGMKDSCWRPKPRIWRQDADRLRQSTSPELRNDALDSADL